VIFTAYFDEADTHGPSPTVILAAHVGHVRQWARFHKKLRALQKRRRFKIFHAKDFKARVGEFDGWSDEQCAGLISDLTRLVKNTLTEGITVHLERERYLNEYRAPPIPKKMNLDSQYGVCFRACLGQLVDFLAKRNYRDRLHIVMEGGHPNVRDCKRIFDDLKARFLRAGADILGSFTVERKVTCPPLMVSDFLAASYSMMRASASMGAPSYADVAPLPTGQEAGLIFLELRPDALRRLKSGFEEMRERDMAEWRARRDAKKTLKASSSKGQS
jgi:hypothetical protein